jgi:hypothetical protein
MRARGRNALDVWEDEGGSSAQVDAVAALRPVVGMPLIRIAARSGPRFRLGRMFTRLVITTVPEGLARFRRKRRLTMVFVTYGMVMLAVFAAVSLAAVRDARLVSLAAQPVARAK